jgi:hypothetical protein
LQERTSEDEDIDEGKKVREGERVCERVRVRENENESESESGWW